MNKRSVLYTLLYVNFKLKKKINKYIKTLLRNYEEKKGKKEKLQNRSIPFYVKRTSNTEKTTIFPINNALKRYRCLLYNARRTIRKFNDSPITIY